MNARLSLVWCLTLWLCAALGACGAAKGEAAATADVEVSAGEGGLRGGDAGDGSSGDGGSADGGSADGGSWPLTAPATIGGKRPAKVLVPKGYKAEKARPVVVLLGGYDYFAKDLDDWVDLSGRVDSGDFVLVLPDGLVDQDGSPFWNATDTCCDWYGTGVDDVGYLLGLLDELQAKVRVDPKRVVLFGHSNGGFMGYRLACDAPERFSAVVSIAGSGFADASKCNAKAAVSVLQVHGVDDDVMPFAGDADAPGALTMMTRWGARGGCGQSSWQPADDKLELVDDKQAKETTVYRFAKGCNSGVDVRLWKISGSDHYPEFRPAFTDQALAWALAQARP